MVIRRFFRGIHQIIFESPIQNLALCVGIGAAVVQSFGYFVRDRAVDKIMYQDYFRDAMSMTKEHPGPEYLFGKPMTCKRLNLRKTQDNFNQDKKGYMRVPVEGPNGKGSIFIQIECDPTCTLQRVEVEAEETTSLSPETYIGKRLLVYDIQKHGPRDAKS